MAVDPAVLQEQVDATVAKALRDPVWFLQDVLRIKQTPKDDKRGQNWDLDIWQKELVESVADVWLKKNGLPTRHNHAGKNKITVRAMHGPGKTFGVAAIMHWFNFVFRGTIVCTAPKEKQLRTRLWPAFRKIRIRSGRAMASLTKVDTTKITWCGVEDWAAHAETASEPENLAGYHDDHLLFIVDEASGLNENMFPVIEGAVSTGNIVIVLLIGNPTKNIGTFFDSHMTERVAQHYHRIHVDLAKTKRVSREWVDQMAQKYGRDSPIFKIRCLGEFADGGKNQLIALQWLHDARERCTEPDGSIPRLRVTVDVSDGGEDETVITAARMYESKEVILRVSRHSFPTAESPILSAEAAARVFDHYGGSATNGDDLVVDGLGVGAGCAGHLIRGIHQADGTLRKYPVVVYKGGAASDDSTKWRNRRVQSYMVARDRLMGGRIAFTKDAFACEDDWDEFCNQACSVVRKEGVEHREDLMTKSEMSAKGIKSPDMIDSLVMLYATQEPDIPGDIPVTVCGAMESAAQDMML